jgi:glycosyltransferase involved in cell wall biosynthesis
VRILFLSDLWDPRIGSSVRQIYQQAELLRADGHETLLVTTTPDRTLVGRATVEGTELARIHSDYPARFRAWKSLRNRAVIAPLRALLTEWKPDVAHSHLIHSHLSYAALTEARAAGAGVVFTAHDSMTYCYQKLDCFHGGEEHGWALRDYQAIASPWFRTSWAPPCAPTASASTARSTTRSACSRNCPARTLCAPSAPSTDSRASC